MSTAHNEPRPRALAAHDVARHESTDCMHPAVQAVDAELVVEFLGHTEAEILEPTIVGVEPAVEENGEAALDLYLSPLRHDDRGPAAGLFGLHARSGWQAIALVVGGTARDLDSCMSRGRAGAVIAVDRGGGVASRLQIDGIEQMDASAGGSVSVIGSIVDALHRVLGLPSPGNAPSAAHTALELWYFQLVDLCLSDACPSWSEAVLIHPGAPCARDDPAVDLSVETVVEATLRAHGSLSWPKLHHHALRGSGPPHLSHEEIAWMDPTFYGRWVLGSLPGRHVAVEMLSAGGQELTAQRVASVATEIDRQLGGSVTLGRRS